MTQDIITWLKSGANAQEGVQLMKRAGAPSLALSLVSSNPSRYKKMMVEWLVQRFGVDESLSVVRQTTDVVVFKEKTKSFREEFPFLNQPNCPVELEALASRKFSRYHDYVKLHPKLRECRSLEECAKVARELLDSYMENRAIWAELNYYQKHKAILGKHPIFAAFARRKNLLVMSVKDLMKRKQQLENNIWRVQSEMKRGDKPHLDGQRRERLNAYQTELAEVNRLLDEE